MIGTSSSKGGCRNSAINSRKGGRSLLKRKMFFRPPNFRFSIRKAYKSCKKRIPSMKNPDNMLTWRNLFFLSSTIKAQFKELEEKQRHKVLSFVFFRNLIRLQNFGKSINHTFKQAAHFIK
jgi:hypothetical protein